MPLGRRSNGPREKPPGLKAQPFLLWLQRSQSRSAPQSPARGDGSDLIVSDGLQNCTDFLVQTLLHSLSPDLDSLLAQILVYPVPPSRLRPSPYTIVLAVSYGLVRAATEAVLAIVMVPSASNPPGQIPIPKSRHQTSTWYKLAILCRTALWGRDSLAAIWKTAESC